MSHMHRLAMLFFIILYSITSFAVNDKELAQAVKCVNFFRYYERKLNLPEDTLYSISINETGKIHTDKKIKISWPWTVNVEGAGFYFDTQREAVDFVKKQIAAGKESIDVGCMQVNLKHHPQAFESIEQAFNPKHNIGYAAGFLRSKYEQLGTWSQAIAHYHSATHHLGEKYKKNIVKIAQNIDHYKSAFKRNKMDVELSSRKPQKFSYVGQINGNKPAFAGRKEKRYRSNMMIYVPNKNPAKQRVS
jgi:soluble lytic murein transglycosylase-like protein